MNGFKLDSESVGSETGRSVSMGDINQDGYADLLIGADTYNFNVGRSYVIFGRTQYWKYELISAC